MAIHTVAFLETLAAAPATLTSITPVNDGVFGMVGASLIPNEEVRLVASVAGGQSLAVAQLSAPSMDISPANVHPLNTFTGWPSPLGACINPDGAVRLPRNEGFSARVQGSSGGQQAIVAWVCDRIDPVPAGQQLLLSFTASATLALNTWGRTNITWDVSFLPDGRYSVIGVEVHKISGSMPDPVAARLVLPGQMFRPGAPIMASATGLSPTAFLDGSLGRIGWFEQGQRPQIELLGFTPGTLSVRGHLRVVRESVGSPTQTPSTRPNWG